MARRHDLGDTATDRIFIGEDLTIRVQVVTKNSTGADMAAADVSGNAYTMEVKQSPGDSTALIDVSTGGGEITFANGDLSLGELSGANSVLVIALSDTETELITAEGLYSFDVWRTDAGSESVVAFGTIFFSDSVRLSP
ncbi:hypothetical protein LCGC14_0587960 [marine sediment metagenome]|uniref:Uncharacterized protein n=1 Tax=marine sediment metagenome TaxID=412755 RepID=A0A0F9UMQ7_9ZZZZ